MLNSWSNEIAINKQILFKFKFKSKEVREKGSVIICKLTILLFEFVYLSFKSVVFAEVGVAPNHGLQLVDLIISIL